MPQEIISQFNRSYAFPIETNRSVATLLVRDAIPSLVRWEGMIVYVVSEQQTYELRGGIDNADWQVFAGSLADAPNDGNEYVRKNQAWALASSGIIDAPVDGSKYGRLNGSWAIINDATWGAIGGTLANQTDLNNALNLKLEDAPSNGSLYARLNGTWTSFVPGGTLAWGDLTGVLSNQTDLQSALNAKANLSHTHLEADITDLQAYLLDAPSDGSEYVRLNGAWSVASGGIPAWGTITGTLSSQTDLQNALNAKANLTHTHLAVDITDFDTEVSNNTSVVANTAKTSFPGFSTLLADYSFTDNSANWDTAFSWGDHAGTYLPIVGGTLTGTLNGRDIIPTLNNTYDLGSSGSRYNAIYGTVIDSTAITNSGNATVGTNLINNGIFYFNTATSGQVTSLQNAGWAFTTDANNHLTFGASTDVSPNSFPDIATINASGTPSIGTDLIDKAYADANYGGGGVWGSITGTLSNQTDLQTELNLKLNTSAYTASDVLAKMLTVDGSGSGLDADLVRGRSFTSSGNRWDVHTAVSSAGVIEIGRYIDFHNTDADTSDNTGRLDNVSQGQLRWSSGATTDYIEVYNNTFQYSRQGANASGGFVLASNNSGGSDTIIRGYGESDFYQGDINIYNGHGVNAFWFARLMDTNIVNAENWDDTGGQAPPHAFWTSSNTTGSTGYPAATGQTFWLRGATSARHFAFWKSANLGNDDLRLGVRNSGDTGWDWSTIWQSANLPYGASTFSPLLTASSGTYTKILSFARYVRIGQMCYITAYWTSLATGTASGSTSITGLPFTSNSYASFEVEVSATGPNFYSIHGKVNNNSTTISILGQTGFDGNNANGMALTFNGSGTMLLSGAYQID